MTDVFIYDAVRTPRGKGREGGGLNGLTPLDLQKTLIGALLERTGLDAGRIDDIILGCVTQVGEQGGNIAKVAALYAGLPASVPGITVNRYCSSGLDACNFAAMKIATGMDELVLAGGVECMSRVPMLSDKATFYSDPAVAQKTRFVPMGLAADLVGSLDGISREECDAYAVTSQQRATRAQSEGRFAKSLVAVTDPGSGAVVEQDECVRPGVTTEKLATFEPLFTEFGEKGYAAAFKAAFPELAELRYLHHAGNSPAVVDGASLVALGSRAAGEAAGLKPRARIRAMANVSSSELLALTGGIDVVAAVLARAGMDHGDVDLVEFNEAFGAVSVKFVRDMPWDAERINPNGGAIALGHAMGATGASLVGTVLDELERQDLGVGLVAVSGAAGIGTGLILERVAAS
ncbi:acetyl-CoA C-acyltransferase [Lentisalinibacter orientalis]|uniref:acetyl-CoA C-acyltransferase n=1 Tax=Lentisalinibacter orientalis TaxID=2992241 RepID=UPI00386FD2D7